MRYALWPKPYRLRSFAGQVMRISDDVRRCVVFIGVLDNSRPGGIACFGTAFFVGYKKSIYLVTNQHIARDLNEMAFAIRVNKPDGTSDNLIIDPVMDNLTWVCNTNDPDVDLAVMPLDFDFWRRGYNPLLLPHEILLSKTDVEHHRIGIGDVCYTIGLFHLLSGNQRNLPVVHTGNIALESGDEKIPVMDWLMSGGRRRRYIEGYLIQTQNLRGLSGLPCFVRPTAEIDDLPFPAGPVNLRVNRTEIFLLGVWQGSWDAPPDEVMAVEQGTSIRVPVGMGVVVPAAKLIEILDLPQLQAQREETTKQREQENLAKPDDSRGG
jgi:hypothetical protein